jgi:hypothetical protein
MGQGEDAEGVYDSADDDDESFEEQGSSSDESEVMERQALEGEVEDDEDNDDVLYLDR